MFVIEDEIHCDWHGQYATFVEAAAEVRRLATLRWDEPPNLAPCTSWQSCGCQYVVIEFDDSQTPWKELRRIPALKVASSGIEWSAGFTSIEANGED